MKNKHVSLVINPRTGQNVAHISDVLAVLAAAGWTTELAIKEFGGHTMQLAQQAAEDGSDMVVAYGGDGTVNQVVNGVMNSKKHDKRAVAVIPGGTANVWAAEIGVPNDPVLAALTLVNSQERKVDIGHVEVADVHFPGEEQNTGNGKQSKKKSKRGSSKTRNHFLLMAGLGLDAAIMQHVSKPLKYKIGKAAVGISAMKSLPEQHAFPIEIRQTQNGQVGDVLWQGEALQVVIGNTRRYADVAEMTPEAYIDDGVLDVCVITGGNPLNTLQQITSLLLRRKPDNFSAEYFHGAHLAIRVPASVPIQVDGSAVKLKDYLSDEEYDRLQQVENAEQVMVTYRFDAQPHALSLAIPCNYTNELFEKEQDRAQIAEHQQHQHHDEKVTVQVHQHEDKNDVMLTDLQRRTEREEVAAQDVPEAGQEEQGKQEAGKEEQEQQEDLSTLERKERSADLEKLLKAGRQVVITGKVSNPAQPGSYIVAGTVTKASTGEARPVAVVITKSTEMFDHQGEKVTPEVVEQLKKDGMLVVEGKKSKRGVIKATRVVI